MEFGQNLVDIRGKAADFLRKRRNALTRWVSRHSNFDAPAAEIQLPLNFGWSLLSMYASATCSTSNYLYSIWMVIQSARSSPLFQSQFLKNFIDEKTCFVVDVKTWRASTNRMSIIIKLKSFVKLVSTNRWYNVARKSTF
jgi:hypothetical protein